MSPRILNTIAMAALGLSSIASAHTWIEQMMVIAPNGTMVGQPGYARGNVLRSDPSFSDPTMVNLLPPNGRTINDILDTDLMCKSTQTTSNQTPGSPALVAAPGSAIALRYQENGHVTLPQNQPGKPPNRGTVYLYGTTQPSPTDTFLSIHRVWTPDGTGGDGRGVLLSTQNFDDGQCYQVNTGAISVARQAEFPHTANSLMGADLWCQQDVAIPSDASGTYTLYWVWDWPTLPGTAGFPDGKQEIYTTCMDVEISGDAADSTSNDFETGQDLDSAAISTEFADITNPTAVTGSTIPFSSVGGGAAPTAAASAVSGTATEFSITTDASGGHSIISASTAAVVPVAASTTVAQSAPAPSATSPGSGFGGHHGSGGDAGQAAGATFTDWESVTMTVFQTVFNKRDGEPIHLPISFKEHANKSGTATQTALAPTSACTGSGSSTYTLRGRRFVPEEGAEAEC
jgi:hypothetical protein